MTLLFVWACSSSGHEDASVTTSGGSGSKVTRGSTGASEVESEAGAEPASGGSGAIAAASTGNDGGSSGPETGAPDSESSAGGTQDVASDGAGSIGGSGPSSTAGTTDVDTSRAGAPDLARAGSDAVGSTAGTTGVPAAGGASALPEPVCDPAEDPSTLDMVLPCDVSTALYVCRNCHGSAPANGVFSSYVTYADIKSNAAKIYGVIKVGTMPKPPYTMSTWQKSTALKWLGKNGTCAIGATKSCQ
ncbi:MAG TPA: hypothetical protein VER11_10130 [Polyangiaceae bacterium]|nr:hypothetical protein [Polyangiaceae bacterium]